MPKITSSQGELIRRVREAARAAYAATIADGERAQRIDGLATAAELCHNFVYGYTSIDHPAVDSDDEILNWTFADVTSDLGAAIWCLSSGFYKAAASNLRNALDLAMTALYFQLRENNDRVDKGWNKFFAEWDRGERDTPTWGEMRPYIAQQQSVKEFNATHACDVVSQLYAHFKNLSSYTHGRAVALDGQAVRAIDISGDAPNFDEHQFDHLVGLTLATVCWICAIWQIVFPHIIETEPLGPLNEPAPYKRIFCGHPIGDRAMAFRPN